MPDKWKAALAPGVAFKADAVLTAVIDGNRRVADIATVTNLPPTTVVRVAALLRDLGFVALPPGQPEFEIVPIFPT